MNKNIKSKEELEIELSELQTRYDNIRNKYEEDISLLKLAEQKIRKSEEKFRKAFMISPDAININRLSDGMYVSINEGFTKILGYTEEDVDGKTSLDLNIWVNPEERYRLVNLLKEYGRVENFEASFRKKDSGIAIGVMSAGLIELDGVIHILNETKDITQQKQLDEALGREQFLINAMMNNLSDYIYLKDTESRFVRINNSHARALGLENAEDAVGKTDFDFFSTEHAQEAYRDEQNIVNSGQVISKLERLTWHNRPDMWVLSTKMPLRNHDGVIIGVFGISRDITEQKNLEDSLHFKQLLLEAIIGNIPDQIYYKDRDSKFILCNLPVALMAGCTSEKDMIGKSDFDFYPINLAQKYFDDEQKLMAQNKPFLDQEEQILNNKTGDLCWNLSSKVPVRDASGEVIGLAGINRDITKRKRAQSENHVIYEISQAMAATSNLDELLKIIHSALGQLVYADNFFVALFDNNNGLFRFPYFIDKFDTTPSPNSMEKSCTAYVYRTVKPLLFTREIFNNLKDLKEVEQVGSSSPSWIGIPLQTPSKVLGVMVLQHYEMENVYSKQDEKFLISIGSQIAMAIERKISEEEIMLKNELLQAINAEKDKFFSIIAHDLRGPISAFVSITELLTEDIQSMSLNEIREIAISMKTDATKLYRLLENLLEWSRLKRGVMEFKPELLQLSKIISSAVDSVTVSAKSKNIEIEISVPDKLEVKADRHMIETVIRNLVSNAVKFSHSGGKVKVDAFRNLGKDIEIQIADNGIGIPVEMLKKLFILSEMTTRKGTNGEASTGIGLLLCKEFIEKHNGVIHVSSETGKGSIFSINLPVI